MSEAFLLNEFKEASFCPYFYKIINKKKIKDESQIAELLDLDLELAKRVFKGMKFFELIEAKYEIYSTHPIYQHKDLSEELNFKLYMLSILREKTGNHPDWKKNAANLLIIEYLIKNNIIFVDNQDLNLIDKLNNFFFQENQYKPLNSRTKEIIKMNTNKMDYWCEIFQFLGFLRRFSSRQYLLYIDLTLFFALIEICPYKKKFKYIGIKELLSWIDENFFLLPLEGNKVPEIIARIFYSLCRQDKIKIINYGDLTLVDLQNKPKYLNIPPNANAIEIKY